MLIENLKKLTQTFGVSGDEDLIRALIKSMVSKKVDKVYEDVMGNLICVKSGKGKKIMIAAHMDEIGLMAIHIDDKGFIRFSNIGGVSQFYSLGQKVVFKNGTVGVVYYEEKEEIKDLKLSKMFIDIGAKNKEEAQRLVKIGDTASFVGEAFVSGDTFISKALDNRSGCAILIETINNMPKTENELYFVFTVQEEVGLRGAKTSAYSIMPDMALAIDITLTGDIPGCHTMEVKCGGGPAIKVKDSSVLCSKEVRKLLETKATELKMPYQIEILDAGGTDAGAIHLTGGGVPSGAISIPCRYAHTPSEMVSISDMENCVKLLIETIK